MTLLDNHLEQISLSASAIADLPFPRPKIFTNALLQPHDITALIRDTEAHERALFTLAPPDELNLDLVPDANVNVPRRSTINPRKHHPAGGNKSTASALSTLLGGDLGEQIRRETSANTNTGFAGADVNALLQGAENLCAAYPIPGASQRTSSLRTRYESLTASIARYEARVAKQSSQLEKMNRRKGDDDDDDDDDEDEEEMEEDEQAGDGEMVITEEDIRKENEEIAELDRKKGALEERVSGMERDLGGLLR